MEIVHKVLLKTVQEIAQTNAAASSKSKCSVVIYILCQVQ